MDDDLYWVRLDDDIYWVHRLPPYSDVILTCDDDHKIWKVFCSNVTLGIPFHSHLMHSGGVVHIVASWHAPSGGCLCLV